MSTETERVQILEMLDQQQITVEQAVELLAVISGEEATFESDIPAPSVESPVLDARKNGHSNVEAEPKLQAAAHQVGDDGHLVPQEGRVVVGPQAPLVGVGDDPVGEPHPADVDAQERGSHNEGGGGHHLGRTGDGPPVFGAKDAQDGRDERAGVAELRSRHGPPQWQAAGRSRGHLRRHRHLGERRHGDHVPRAVLDHGGGAVGRPGGAVAGRVTVAACRPEDENPPGLAGIARCALHGGHAATEFRFTQ